MHKVVDDDDVVDDYDFGTAFKYDAKEVDVEEESRQSMSLP
jgi:hypothetical protein